jgi:DNA-binding PadR family transcriptional regulator
MAEEDRRRAEGGLVELRSGDEVWYKHIDEITRDDRQARIESENARAAWIQERLNRQPARSEVNGTRSRLRTDDFLHTSGHFSHPASPRAYCAKVGVLLVVAWSAAGSLAPRRALPTGWLQRGRRMDGFHRLHDEKWTHPGEIPVLPDGRWLVPFLLLHVRVGGDNVYELAERLGGLGFGVTPAELHRTLQRMKNDGLVKEDPIVPDGSLPESGATGKWYDLTVAGESYLDFWGDSLEQYAEEVGLFLHLYKGGRDAHTRPATVRTDSGVGLARFSSSPRPACATWGSGPDRPTLTAPGEVFSATLGGRSSGKMPSS